MLTAVQRSKIFHSSVFTDNFISEMQERYAVDFDPAIKAEAAILKRAYDHLAPFQPIDPPINSDCVLAYAASSKKDYADSFSKQLLVLFDALNIDELYLMQFTNTNPIKHFPFQNFNKRNKFKRLAGNNGRDCGYRFHIKDLQQVFPLFFFSGHYDSPVIFLLTANGEVPLSLHLCDDGNLHLNFQEQYQQHIYDAADNAGLIRGDIEICEKYSLMYLEKKLK
jgi:hypothetical protein